MGQYLPKKAEARCQRDQCGVRCVGGKEARGFCSQSGEHITFTVLGETMGVIQSELDAKRIPELSFS